MLTDPYRKGIEEARDERAALTRQAGLLRLRGGKLLADAVREAHDAGIGIEECARLAGMSKQGLYDLLARYP